jgi:hypothetical protein
VVDDFNLHVVISQNLTAQADFTEQTASLQPSALGGSHALWFAFDEVNATGRAARVTATLMQNIDAAVFNREYQPFVRFSLDICAVA